MVGIIAIALIFLMNVSNAVNHYGMLSNNLWTQVFAQCSSSSGGGGSTSGSGMSCDKGSSQTDLWGWCDDVLVLAGAQMRYYCNGGGSSTDYCTKGYENHVYDCDGNWLGFTSSTQFVSCNFPNWFD